MWPKVTSMRPASIPLRGRGQSVGWSLDEVKWRDRLGGESKQMS